MTNQTRKKRHCAKCGKEIEMSDDVIGVQEGVMGPRGFVPLDDMKHLCSEECFESFRLNRDSLREIEGYQSPRRIP